MKISNPAGNPACDPKPLRIVVAVSGSGRTLTNFLEHQSPEGCYLVAGVIASRPDCRGAGIAIERGLPLYVGDFAPSKATQTAEELNQWLASLDAGLIALGGFLKMFPALPDWQSRVVNIHPALLPGFGGKGMYGHHVHEAVLRSNASESGATVHFVNQRYDEGNIISQITVPVLPGDSTDSLADRVFHAECRLYPHVINSLATGKLPLPDGKIERLRYEP